MRYKCVKNKVISKISDEKWTFKITKRVFFQDLLRKFYFNV